ncbi:hypothetical protein TrST_g3311 [Triparma strigata]|uniref:Cytochrome P450 n=1 Tax=Triparma strigata TaxID=1606541 RepID=A0A9W7BE60_9STRA|nr:hypothetical protein TrST_g3311 [Triparma strigata]
MRPLALLFFAVCVAWTEGFLPRPLSGRPPLKRLKVSEMDRVETRGVKKSGEESHGGRNEDLLELEVLDSLTYEASLAQQWDDVANQKGFDWEMEKLRRYAAGLTVDANGDWVRSNGSRDWTFSPAKKVNLYDDDGASQSLNAGGNIGVVNRVELMDTAKVFLYNILSAFGFGPLLGMAAVPTAEIQKYEGSFFSFIKGVLGGDLQTLAGGPLFLLLAVYYKKYGPVFNLAFGPKSFLIVNDPVMAKHILKSNVDAYDKGVLAEILEPIMGKGLIPADPETWKVRRRVIVPGFHKKWLNTMVTLFADCGDRLNDDIEQVVKRGNAVEMEERFCSVSLDIIGKAVFNYDFGSVQKESPVVKAVYRTLREAEHRSLSVIPYWNLPYADKWMEGQVEFSKDMGMLDDILADLINGCIKTRKEASVEELEERDNSDDPSLLRFLVDMRDEDLSSKQLRDDLMTMLIAGHETTAAVLTWTLFELSRGDPRMLEDIQDEIDEVMKGKSRPDYDDIVAMKKLRMALIESLRLYPEPPILIRRALKDDVLPAGGSNLKNGIKVLKGSDIFISTWNLHRSKELWGEDAEIFDPTRWDRNFANGDVEGWEGYNAENVRGLYPNEIASDFSFLPFGGGQRKCVGDQFAVMEATVVMAMLLQKFEFTFTGNAEDVGMRTGATIHTMNGLNMIPREKGSRTLTLRGEGGDRGGYWAEKNGRNGGEDDGGGAGGDAVKLDKAGCPFN